MTKKGVPVKDPASANTEIKERNQRAALKMFAGAVIDMSWQLALVVLIPIIGGVELDRHLRTLPAFTIVGAVIALAGYYAVVRRMYKQYSGRGIGNSASKGGGK